MKKNKFFDLDNWLQNPRFLLYAIILIVVLFFIIRTVLRYLRKSDDDKLLKAVGKSIDRHNLSYPDVQYKVWADRLDTAMRGAGTDEATIFYILQQLKNSDDWFALVEAFGVREYGNWFTTSQGGLINWLDTDLTTDEKAEAAAILTNIGVSL